VPMSEEDAEAIRAEMRARTIAAAISAALVAGFWLAIVMTGEALNFDFVLIAIIATSFASILAFASALPRLWYRLRNRAASDLAAGTIIQATGAIPLVGTVRHTRSGRPWMTYAIDLGAVRLKLPDEVGTEMRAASESTVDSKVSRFGGTVEYAPASNVVFRISSSDGTFHYQNRHLAVLEVGPASDESPYPITKPQSIVTELPSTVATELPPKVEAVHRSAAQYSSDPRWWWDGTQWQSAISPDGRWRWDGTRWIPRWIPRQSLSLVTIGLTLGLLSAPFAFLAFIGSGGCLSRGDPMVGVVGGAIGIAMALAGTVLILIGKGKWLLLLPLGGLLSSSCSTGVSMIVLSRGC
jgi:hypothetical protein